MKILFALLTLSLPAQAAPLPDCWTTDGHSVGFNKAGEEIADGEWLILVNLQKVSKDDLVFLLGAVARGNLHSRTYPSVFGAENAIFLTSASPATQLPRPQLIQRANAQLETIRVRPGVESIECNGISHPAN